MGEEIAAVSARISAAQWKLLSLIREFDARGGWEGALTCAHWLSWRVGLDLGAAREKVRVARALGRLPLIDEAMRSGHLSYSKVRAITRVATEENQEALVHMARNATGSQMERIGRAYRRVLQRLEDGRMQQAPTERWIHTKHLGFGMVSIEAQLPAEEAEVVLKALDAIRYAAKEKLTSNAAEASDVAGPRYPIPRPSSLQEKGLRGTVRLLASREMRARWTARRTTHRTADWMVRPTVQRTPTTFRFAVQWTSRTSAA